ncbi:MBL fold metallo-hydrolase [Ideonella sp. YS5]|uniref:MBL fold metallo-hydrolase n=1 Tax=Ideonella sp. YS5 TaxID=3453714 RepID=UPI003EECBB46
MGIALHRPVVLLGLAVLLVACAAAPAFLAEPVGTQAIQLAGGVYMVPGASGVADEQNLGRIGNAGFIVGDEGVLAIDTGTSYAQGRALLEAIGRVTDKPVREVLVTQVHPEFVFGGAAFRERGIPVVMHDEAARLMTSRCSVCLRQLHVSVGDEPLRGTATYAADRSFTAPHSVASLGRPVQVLYYGHSSGPGDVAVFDESSGVLFAGGLLDNQRIPDIQDADLEGWKRALAALRTLPVRRVVPGHGPAGSPALIDAVERYLVQLEDRARALAQAGTDLMAVPDAAALPEFSAWAQYDTIHPRNATIAYLRFERELFFK